MTNLTPLTLEDGTTLYIEATPPDSNALPTSPDPNPKRGLLPSPPTTAPIAQSFQAVETTIRAYTTYTLRAFKSLAIAEVSEVTLKFGVNVDIQTGLPYIANGKAGCSTEIVVKCVFPTQKQGASES